MASLQGLKGLIPDPQISDQVMDEGVLEARANAPAAEHGAYGSQHYGYSGSVPTDSPFSGFSVYDGYDPAYVMEYGAGGQVAENRYGLQTSGTEYDETPTTH